MKIVVFGGPSIQGLDRIPDAVYLPPAKHADIISLVYNDRPDVIVFIDGRNPAEGLSVWHSEIMEALNKGVRVYGAGGVGAIRAVELEKWGMIGQGEVYRLYKEAGADDDSEVLCEYAVEEGRYIRSTEPMVNIRATICKAVSRNVLPAEHAGKLLHAARSVFYRKRTWEAVFAAGKDAGLASEGIEKVRVFIQTNYVDQQREDACDVLKTVAALTDTDLPKDVPPPHDYDLFFHSLYERDRRVPGDREEVPLYAFGNHVSLHHPDIEDVNSHALNREIMALLADEFKFVPTPEEIQVETGRFMKRHALADAQALTQWLKDNDLTETDFEQLMAKHVKMIRVQAWYSVRLGFAKNTRYLLEELRLRNEYVTWKKHCEQFEELARENMDKVLDLYASTDVKELLKAFAKHNTIAWHLPLQLFLQEINMTTDTFHLELAKDRVVNEKRMAMIEELLPAKW